MQKIRVNNMTKYIPLFILFLPAAFADITQLQPPKHIKMLAPRTENALLRKLAESIYKESFKRLNVNVSFSGCVPSFCGQHVTNGRADGEMGRTLLYNEKYPELIRTTQSIFSIKFSAFSTSPSIKLNSWDDLIGKNYKISYIDANYIASSNLKTRMNTSNLITVEHWRAGLNKILTKEVDIYIGVERTVLAELKGMDTGINLVGTLETAELYPYFNKKHRLLSEQLAIKLNEMKFDGTMGALLSSY